MTMMKPLFTWRSAICKSYLSSTTRHTLITLSLHMNELGESCFPSTAKLAEETGLSERSVCTHLEMAEDFGWLCREYKKTGKDWKKTYYYPRIPEGRPVWMGKQTLPHTEEARIKAIRIIGNDVKAGKLKKEPCQKCGDVEVQAHHYDYDKTREIIWLCAKHHRRIHAFESATEGRSVGQHATELRAYATEPDDIMVLKDVQSSTSSNSTMNNYVARATDILNFLNEKTGRKFDALTPNGEQTASLQIIIDRLKSGYEDDKIRQVIVRQCRLWINDPEMRKFLQPSTLFRKSKFENYLSKLGT